MQKHDDSISNLTRYKYLIFLVMLCMTIKLTTIVLIYKIINIGFFPASASTLIMPIWFILGDIIAEVYGYKIARHVVWIAILCQLIFAFLCTSLVSVPIQNGWLNQEAFNLTLDKLPRVALASSIAIITSTFINIYTLSKWKIILHGKYFWLRSIGASSVGELFFTIFAYLAEFLGIVPLSQLLQLMTVSFIVKFLLNPILVIPANILVSVLKKAEKVDTYDHTTNFNPFIMHLHEQNTSIPCNPQPTEFLSPRRPL